MSLPPLALVALTTLLLSGCALYAPKSQSPRATPKPAERGTLQGTTRQVGDRLLHYDKDGRPAGTTRQVGDRLLHYDKDGRPAGTTRQVGDRLLHYDKDGRPTGTTRQVGDRHHSMPR